MEYRVLLYASCNNNGTNTKEFLFDTRIKKLVPLIEAEFEEKQYLVISFNNTDEKRLLINKIPTVSAQTLISVAGGCSFRLEDLDFIFKKGVQICYSEIFGDGQKADRSVLFQSNGFWNKIAYIIMESIKLIYQQGLQNFLSLEIKVTPVLHEMFDSPYPVDAESAKAVYKTLKRELVVFQKQIQDENVAKMQARKRISDKDNKEFQNLICQRDKLENKLTRFPKELVDIQQKRANIYAKFRSIGTDTFRISTYSANIQGFPKELRQCLLPRQGNKLIEYDVVCSQLILLAGLAEEDSLIQSYLKNMDLYTFISSEILEKSVEEITTEERKIYKTIILQSLYGAGIDTIQKRVQSIDSKIGNNEIREFKRRFYKMFPAIRKYSGRVKTVEEITLPTGRKYCMTNIVPYARLSHILQYIEAEILRKILIILSGKSVELRYKIYLCIHDSVFIETSNEDIAEIQEFIQRCFNQSVLAYFDTIKKLNIKENMIYEKN